MFTDYLSICREFARRGSCRFRNCKFSHDVAETCLTSESKPPQQKAKLQLTSSDRDFRAWRKDIPRYTHHTRPLGHRLGWFFKEARRLIDQGDGVLQDVVRALSQEGGLKRIQELVERDFDLLSASTKSAIFKTQILPFLEVITHPYVLASLILEQAVGTIYNFLFGIFGKRGVGLVGFLVSVLENAASDELTTASYLELCLHVFWQIIDLNSTAFVHKPFKPLAMKFEQIFVVLHSSESANLLYGARTRLERILRRLDIGSSLPGAQTSTVVQKSHHPTATPFVVHRRPPGGRHDNDSADICEIQIMPTSEEILSSRSEYLPVKDPQRWHIGGVSGLLDRNFRLLREDTVGQLRDTIHALLKPSNTNKDARSNQVRTYVHDNVRVVHIHFDRFAGLLFVVQFCQPNNVREMNKRQREEWWEQSKRLQSGALVCLLLSNQRTIFCTIARPPRPRQDEFGQTYQVKLGSLAEEKDTATVALELVQFADHDVQSILNKYKSRETTTIDSLVEFPGILLAGFEPTLQALQRMKKSNDLPFPDLLAPGNPETHSGMLVPPPPTYALRPGFSFNLSCLLNDPNMRLSLTPGQPFDIRQLQEYSTLDNAQAVALVNSLQRNIGLIQGPPGTGKSFTGVALIKVLLANRANLREGIGPIICVCYTNHALDQLLEDLVEQNITTQIVRIGSRSQSKVLERYSLNSIVEGTQKTKAERGDRWELHQALDKNEDEFDELDYEDSESSLKRLLQHYHPQHYDQLFGVDEDGFHRQKRGRGMYKQWLHGGKTKTKAHPRSAEALQGVNIHTMTREERKILHEHWMAENRQEIHDKASDILEQQRHTKAVLDNIRDEINLRCLRDAHIIGVTTTGLARNLNMLRRLRSKVVLCEEAGEVLESHLLSALLPSVEHAILIGDHLQLRPQVQNYDLSRENHNGGEQYSLDMSLFERLVAPDEQTGVSVAFSTLEAQRRMHPSIAQLVRETLYPSLEDAAAVSQYPEVSGMRKRLFWLNHRHQEARKPDKDSVGTSHWNDYEINMTTALVNHLIQQGTYSGGDIAVLTPYLGQLHRLRNRLSDGFAIVLGEKDQEDLDKAGLTSDTSETKTGETIVKTNLLQTLRVATVDNFQGEEAKVIVISLVRSNKQNRCGFLRTSNRINVLLSRAKHGMYIIGNSATSSHVTMWAQVMEILQRDGNFGTSLDLRCPRHPDSPIAVSEPDHFLRYSPEGGCNERCINRLKCGHSCKQKCHSTLLHDAVYCQEPCPRPLPGCDHACPKSCGDPCPAKCMVNVHKPDRTLPCGHLAVDLPCWQTQDVSTVSCLVPVEKQVPGCGHVVTVQCHIDITKPEYKCWLTCREILPCGHTCKRPCWKCTVRTEDGVNRDHGRCLQVCGRNQSTCAHSCGKTCHGTEPCPPCNMPCDVQCAHSKCPKSCSEPCTPCAESTCLSSCPHSQCSMPCAAPCDHIPCSRRCEKLLGCGHQCPSICGEICPSREFCQQCASPEVKERVVDFILAETYAEINLDENPCIFPRCGHFLTVESMDGQMDMKKYYVMDADKPMAIRSSSDPFSVDDIKRCATCRGSLRDLSRYGRLVRRAILDESTKRFLLYLNREYVPLAQELPEKLAALPGTDGVLSPLLFQENNAINIEGSRHKQFTMLDKIITKHGSNRWKQITGLRNRIARYYSAVKIEEQPLIRVRNLVENVRRHKRATGAFEFDESVVQTKGWLLATALMIRLDIGLLGDFLSLYKRSDIGATECTLRVNLKANFNECRTLINSAVKYKRVSHQVEGYIFLVQLNALERSQISDPAQGEQHADKALKAIASAKELCRRYPGQTRGLSDEVDEAERMFNGGSFYSAVTNEERKAVIAAMAKEFLGTGHWYYCQNGHPFTIGECGGPMQVSTCPECGAPVGGQQHMAADGVTRADDLESGLNRLNI